MPVDSFLPQIRIGAGLHLIRTEHRFLIADDNYETRFVFLSYRTGLFDSLHS